MSEEAKITYAYVMYYSPRCRKCQRFLEALKPLTTAKYTQFFNTDQRRPPPDIQYVPTLRDTKSNMLHVGSQAFDLLKLWLQGEHLISYTPHQTGLQFADVNDSMLAVQEPWTLI